MQPSWSSGAIEPHGDPGGTSAHLDNNASPASQLWAPNGSKLTHLKTGADNNSVGFLVNHDGYSIQSKKSSPIKQSVKSQGSGYIESGLLQANSSVPDSGFQELLHRARHLIVFRKAPTQLVGNIDRDVA